MRKNLTRIVSLALAFALLSVSAFAALEGNYADGTYTVTGGDTGYATSLIIVEGAYDELPVANGAVTDAVYIGQTDAAATGAVFEGVSLPGTVYTAFFSNESENSATSAQIVNATVTIAADKTAFYTGESATITVDTLDGATVKFYDGEEELVLTGSVEAGYTFAPAEAGTYTITAKATISGAEIASNALTFTVTDFSPIIEATGVVLEDVYTVDEEGAVKDGEVVTPVYINLTLPAAPTQMKWALTTETLGLVCSEAFSVGNVDVSGAVTFAAIIKNGLRMDGVVNDHETVTAVDALFEIGDTTYFTSEAVQAEFEAE